MYVLNAAFFQIYPYFNLKLNINIKNCDSKQKKNHGFSHAMFTSIGLF